MRLWETHRPRVRRNPRNPRAFSARPWEAVCSCGWRFHAASWRHVLHVARGHSETTL